MGLLLVVVGGGAVLLLIWAICRTPAGEKADAEAAQATITAHSARAEAIFGEDTAD